ncbi:hypothetical protein RF11_16456 [Thelohanellus kitauei]|uniref:Uncharacterized protein n=1 Tax=Thelohanellus kitauei TaxID=669202 RepID=A0A0C2MIU5_THEKT|nr:hypothetical protein RF11_16456 [Thelohanellus kitauei]
MEVPLPRPTTLGRFMPVELERSFNWIPYDHNIQENPTTQNMQKSFVEDQNRIKPAFKWPQLLPMINGGTTLKTDECTQYYTRRSLKADNVDREKLIRGY